MKSAILRFGLPLAIALSLAACGGGGSSDPVTPPPNPTTLKEVIAAAAANPANDSAENSAAPFTVLQNAGVPAVVVNSPPQVNFTVFSDGAVVKTLTTSNARLALVKLVPGTGGNPDQWVNYVSNEVTGKAGYGPGGTPVLATARQASTDSGGTLVYNDDGYYTYTFKTDVTDPTKTNGAVFEPNRTHRIAIQLSYTNAAGETVRVNPYFDVTFDASGKSVAVTDPGKTRKMADVSSCNGCHEKLALHGGGRVDTQYCVMCHNPGTTDPESGNVLTMATMVHKIHSGRLLKKALDDGKGGEDYTIWGYRDSKHPYAEVGFPQDLRNCTKCHDGSNPATPQGDNWKKVVSKEACLTCHANKAGSDWDTVHKAAAETLVGPGSVAKDLTNANCVFCHGVGSKWSSERVHWNQNEENAAKYRMNIESVVFNDTADGKGRSVTVKYFVSDPTNGNAAYDLVTPDCTYPAPNVCRPPSGAVNTKFGNLQFRVTWPAMVGQPLAVTEYTAYNIGGSSANAYAANGVNDGSNRYTITIPIPNDTPNMVVQGTARVVSLGQVKEPKLEVKWATDPRPEVVPREYVNTVMRNASKEFAVSGTLNPRREIVSNEKCNVCHGALGTTSGSNTLANAFHGGARNAVEACVVCHDPNRMSSTIMTNGLTLSESYQFKRMIHGIHGNSKRAFPFTHGNRVAGPFSKDGILLADAATGAVSSTSANNPVSAPAGTLFEPWLTTPTVLAGTPFASGVENYAAEVAWPGVGLNCNVCHVNNSYKIDRGPVGAVVSKPIDSATLKAKTDPLSWVVITPKAATCTACHDSAKAIGHVASFGGAGFGNFGSVSQKDSMKTQEICADCHSSGSPKGVDIVHGQK